MQRYKPFERQREKNIAPLIWAGGLALFAVALFFALMLIEQHVVITEDGLWFDFSGGAPVEKVQPDFVQVPEIVLESETAIETGVSETFDPSLYPKDAVYAMELPLDAEPEKLSYYPVNTVILPVRPGSGEIGYTSSVEAAARHAKEETVDLAALIESYHTAGYQVFARISVYADSAFVADNPASALKSISSDAWSDNFGNVWANPYSSVFNDYFDDLLEEYASFKFDGYLFENVTFPYAGKLSDCYYVDDTLTERRAEIAETVESIITALRGRKVWYLLDLPTVLDDGANEVSGVDIASLNEEGIGVAPMLTVSSSGNLAYQLSEAGYCTAVDYEEVKEALARLESPALPFLPFVEVAGSLNDALKDGMQTVLAGLYQSSGKAFLLSLGVKEYTPAFFPEVEEKGNEPIETEVSSETEPDSETESEQESETETEEEQD